MQLTEDITTADLSDPQPGQVFAGRLQADMGEPFRPGRVVALRVLAPGDPMMIGTLYILDDGSDVAILRLQGESPDLWIVDRFSGDGGSPRCALARRRWRPRAAITVQ